MKKCRIMFLILSLFCLLMAGCDGSHSPMDPESSDETMNNALTSIDMGDLLEHQPLDNTLDAYTTVLNTHFALENQSPEDYSYLDTVSLGAAGAACYRSYADHWECSIANSAGENQIFTPDLSKYNLTYVNYLGYVPGTEQLYCSRSYFGENTGEKYIRVMELDEHFECVEEWQWDCYCQKVPEVIYQMILDGEGNYHLITRQFYEDHIDYSYSVVTPQGKLLAGPTPLPGEEELGSDSRSSKLVLLPDKTAALQVQNSTNKLVLFSYQRKLNCWETISTLEKSYATNLFLTMFDEQTRLYADSVGLHISSPTGDDKTPLYLWKNHGLLIQEIFAIEAREDCTIHILYRDAKGINYLVLKPVTEKQEITTLQLVVGQAYNNLYKILATEFNRRYPAYHLEILEGVESTRLQTELISGQGPVLIDSAALASAFYAQEALWEPLDGILEQMDLTKELWEKAMDAGRFGNTLRAVPLCFNLSTVITPDPELTDWDYAAFFETLSKAEGLECLAQGYEGTELPILSTFFLREPNDSAFFDAAAQTTSFTSKEFDVLITNLDTYHQESWARDPRLFREGKVFCQPISLRRPEDIALMRIEYGDDLNLIGYPGKNGSVQLLETNALLAINTSAPKVQKEGALLFLNLLLSYDGQKIASEGNYWQTNYAWSVRKDITKEQLDSLSAHTHVSDGVYDGTIDKHYNPEKDREIFKTLMKKAVPRKYLPKELLNILFEELDAYFEKQINRDNMIQHLENRVKLYLQEQS